MDNMASSHQHEDDNSQASTNTQPSEYQRRPGAANHKGTRFEIKMSALLYLRALQTSESFRLAVNDASAGDFDDIVLICKRESKEQEFLMQLKHHKGTITHKQLSSDKGKFSLNKYYRSVKEMGKPSIAERFKNTHFVFFTNAAVNLGASVPIKNVDLNVKTLLSTGGNLGHIYRFDINDNICAAFKEESEASEFTKRLIICSSQASVEVLDDIIEQEFISFCKKIIPQYEALHVTFLDKVEAWWEMTDLTPHLTECWEQWDNLKPFLTGCNALLSQVKFHNDALADLANKILDPRCPVVRLIYDEVGEQLRTLKVLQALSRKRSPRFLFASIAKAKGSLWELWDRGWCDVLVVDLGHNSIPEQLLRIVDKHRGTEHTKRLILVSGDCHNLPQSLNKELKSHWHDVCDTFSFHQLDEPSQDLILEHRVNFQGKEINLRSLGVEHILKGYVLDSVLMCGKMELGYPLPGVDSSYIPRTLTKTITIKRKILDSNEIPDIFYILGIEVNELQQLIAAVRNKKKLDEKCHTTQISRFIALSSETEFQKIAQKLNCEKPFHLLQMTKNSFCWIQSHGDTQNLCQYVEADSKELENVRKLINKCKTCTPREEELVDAELSTVIVAGEPGIGKSSLLSHITNRLKLKYPSYWIIQLDLSKSSSYLQEMKSCQVTKEGVFGMLAAAAGLKSKTVPEALLKDAIECTGNVCILCDSFDEVGPRYTETVLSILSIIQQTKVHILWATSRRVLEEKLEAEMTTKIFTIQPLNEIEVLSYFSNFWGEERAKRLLEMVKNAFHSFHGIPISSFPLHMMMIREVYNDLIMSHNFYEISKLLNINDLYEKFIEIKLNLYYNEKSDMNANNAGSDCIMEDNRQVFMERHMLCSLLVLNITEELREQQRKEIFNKVEGYINIIREGKEKSGIIDGLVDGTPHFIHRTFAEYFAARWLAEHKQQNLLYILNMIFKPQFNVVCVVFSRIMAKGCPVHLALLNNDLQGFKNELEGGVSGKDAGGRTPLHLAAQNLSTQAAEMMNLLLAHGADMELCDTLLECTPLYYAAKAEAWEMVKLLLQHGAQVKDSITQLKPVKQFLTSIRKIEHIFCMSLELPFEVNWKMFVENKTISHLVARYGDVVHMKLLLKNGAKTDIKDINGNTPLHESICHANLTLIKLLLNSGALVMAVNNYGDTPLHVALRYDNLEVVKLLLDHGALVTAVNKYGETALQVAIRRRNSGTVKLLKKHEALTTALKKKGVTLLAIAGEETCC